MFTAPVWYFNIISNKSNIEREREFEKEHVKNMKTSEVHKTPSSY